MPPSKLSFIRSVRIFAGVCCVVWCECYCLCGALLLLCTFRFLCVCWACHAINLARVLFILELYLWQTAIVLYSYICSKHYITKSWAKFHWHIYGLIRIFTLFDMAVNHNSSKFRAKIVMTSNHTHAVIMCDARAYIEVIITLVLCIYLICKLKSLTMFFFEWW